MQSITLGKSDLESSRLVYGCMRIAGDGSAGEIDKGKRAVHAALEAGYTHFDHADIYGGGSCEEVFGELLRESPDIRDDIVITTKCGIRFAGEPTGNSPGRYDFSAAHITNSVEGSLKRLGVERIDLLLLHRPDYLFHPEEVALTFEALKASGAVAHFGVSNFSPSQVELLRSAVSEPILVNQLEINLHNIATLNDGTLDQCLRLGITPQSWGPIGGIVRPAWGNTFTADDEHRIRTEVERQCGIYEVEPWIIALVWLLKHPSCISPIVGSTNPSRIATAVEALGVDYSREDWYRLLEARNGQPVP